MSTTISGSNGIVFPDATSMQTGQQAVKAWVNFNGTGTVSIRAGYNVASITDNGAGSYAVNLTTALLDANYSATASCRGQSDGDSSSTIAGAGVLSTTIANVYTKNSSNSLVDSSAVSVAIFR